MIKRFLSLKLLEALNCHRCCQGALQGWSEVFKLMGENAGTLSKASKQCKMLQNLIMDAPPKLYKNTLKVCP